MENKIERSPDTSTLDLIDAVMEKIESTPDIPKMDGMQKAIFRMRSRGVLFRNDILASHGFSVCVNECIFPANTYVLAKKAGYFLDEEAPAYQ